MTRNALRPSPALVTLMGTVLLASGCLFLRTRPDEENLAFDIDRNQLVLSSVLVEGRAGRFIVATAMPVTVLSSRFATESNLDRMMPFQVLLAETSTKSVAANVMDLGDEIDGLVGADVLGPVVTIDYRREILAVRKRRGGDRRDLLTYRFSGQPAVPIRMNGTPHEALVDTTIPDTLIAPVALSPTGKAERANATIELGGVTFENLDVNFDDVDQIRIGNRLLSEFLVMIDYGGGSISLWRYP